MDEGSGRLTSVEAGVLLYMGQLFEPAIAIGAFVWLLARMHPYVLHQLMIGAETLQALLALVGLNVISVPAISS